MRRRSNVLTSGSLFAGYGGLDLGLAELLDHSLAFVSEIDAAASQILARGFPDVPNLGDITAIRWTPDCPACRSATRVYRPGISISPDQTFYRCTQCVLVWPLSIADGAGVAPAVHVLSGGSPCQDLSVQGFGAGMVDGTRSNLWGNMLTAIDLLQPRLVIWENVRGAFTAPAHSQMEPCPGCFSDHADQPSVRALERVLIDLAAIGFDAQWHGIRASDVGACHERYRIFVVAWPRHLPKPRLVNRTLSYGASATPDLHASAPMIPVPHLLGTPRTADGIIYPLPVIDNDGNPRGRLEAQVAQLRLSAGGTMGSPMDWGKYASALQRHANAFNQRVPLATQPSGIPGREQLAVAFVEFMMGLPQGWVDDVSLARLHKMRVLGNGVVPRQAATAIRHVLTTDEWGRPFAPNPVMLATAA